MMPCTPNRTLYLSTFFIWLSITVANWFIFMVVPNEQIMGAVQRIFYFHVAAAIACYVAFGLVLIGSIIYLATLNRDADLFSAAAGEVGFVLCTVVLISGMIWGHSAWNTWFRWEEPRLVTFLILWLISLSYTALRNFGDPNKTASHAAVLGILGGVSVPLVYASIKLLPQSARLHPEVLEHGGLKHWSYITAFCITVVAFLLLEALLIHLRYRIGQLERETRTLDIFREVL